MLLGGVSAAANIQFSRRTAFTGIEKPYVGGGIATHPAAAFDDDRR